MIYVVHIVKEIKPLSCNWMDYVSLQDKYFDHFALPFKTLIYLTFNSYRFFIGH